MGIVKHTLKSLILKTYLMESQYEEADHGAESFYLLAIVSQAEHDVPTILGTVAQHRNETQQDGVTYADERTKIEWRL